METRVQDLLDATMRSDGLVAPNLTDSDQALLAAWFSKCAYAYDAGVFSEPNRAWPLDAYRNLKSTQRPAASATIWLGKNTGLLADVCLSVTPLYMIPLQAGATHDPGRPKVVSAWMSANAVVFFGVWMPPEMIEANMPARLAAEAVSAMTQIWPVVDGARWPSDNTTDEQAFALIDLLASVRDEHGVRVDRLTFDQVEGIKTEMRSRASANGLRPTYAIVNRVRAVR